MITTFYKTIVSLLLLFNGTGALYGGWSLITRPDGSGIHLSMDWLEHTPFQNYLIPGLILFVTNGIFSIVVLATMLLSVKGYSLLVVAQGAVLTGWIAIQMILMQTVYYLHIILGSVGILLLVFGWMLLHWQKKRKHA